MYTYSSLHIINYFFKKTNSYNNKHEKLTKYQIFQKELLHLFNKILMIIDSLIFNQIKSYFS